jgi:hypothetical protein
MTYHFQALRQYIHNLLINHPREAEAAKGSERGYYAIEGTGLAFCDEFFAGCGFGLDDCGAGGEG